MSNLRMQRPAWHIFLSGSKWRIKNNNGLDVTVEKLLLGNRKVVMEEEIVKNVKKEEEVAGTHRQQDSGVLEILSNQKLVLSVILSLKAKCMSHRSNIIIFIVLTLNNSFIFWNGICSWSLFQRWTRQTWNWHRLWRWLQAKMFARVGKRNSVAPMGSFYQLANFSSSINLCLFIIVSN